MPFRHAGVRPGPSSRSKTRAHLLSLFSLTPILVRVLPWLFTTYERRADRFILESADINRVGA